MFDFEYAAWADRHEDFYALHSFGDAFTERAFDAYAAASGVRPSIRRVAAHHLSAAFHALAEALTTEVPGQVARPLRWLHGALAGSPGRLLRLPAAGSEDADFRPRHYRWLRCLDLARDVWYVSRLKYLGM